MQSAPKHWDSENAAAITQAFLDAHPFASSMRLTLRIPPGSTLGLLTPRGAEQLTGDGQMSIFDVLKVPSAVAVELRHGSAKLSVQLTAGTELTHVDLLRLVYEQHRAEVDAAAANQSDWGPLLLPALRAMEAALTASGATSSVLGTTRRRLLDAWLF